MRWTKPVVLASGLAVLFLAGYGARGQPPPWSTTPGEVCALWACANPPGTLYTCDQLNGNFWPCDISGSAHQPLLCLLPVDNFTCWTKIPAPADWCDGNYSDPVNGNTPCKCWWKQCDHTTSP
jgi:hypothetical protein